MGVRFRAEAKRASRVGLDWSCLNRNVLIGGLLGLEGSETKNSMLFPPLKGVKERVCQLRRGKSDEEEKDTPVRDDDPTLVRPNVSSRRKSVE